MRGRDLIDRERPLKGTKTAGRNKDKQMMRLVLDLAPAKKVSK